MRDETERPEAAEAGVAVLIGTSEDLIVSHVDQLLNDKQASRLAEVYRLMAMGGRRNASQTRASVSSWPGQKA